MNTRVKYKYEIVRNFATAGFFVSEISVGTSRRRTKQATSTTQLLGVAHMTQAVANLMSRREKSNQSLEVRKLSTSGFGL
jgi:hypothetical protein